MWQRTSYAVTVSPSSRHFQVELVGGRTAPPLAFDQSITTAEDHGVWITLTALDPQGGTLSYAVVAPRARVSRRSG